MIGIFVFLALLNEYLAFISINSENYIIALLNLSAATLCITHIIYYIKN